MRGKGENTYEDVVHHRPPPYFCYPLEQLSLTPWPITKFINPQGNRGTCWLSHLKNINPVVRIQYTYSHHSGMNEAFQSLCFCPVPILWSAQDTNTTSVKVLTLPITLPPLWLWNRATPFHPWLIRLGPLQDSNPIINETAGSRHCHHDSANLHLYSPHSFSLESWTILRTSFVHYSPVVLKMLAWLPAHQHKAMLCIAHLLTLHNAFPMQTCKSRSLQHTTDLCTHGGDYSPRFHLPCGCYSCQLQPFCNPPSCTSSKFWAPAQTLTSSHTPPSSTEASFLRNNSQALPLIASTCS